VKVTVVGCSPAWPNPGSAHSGYLVESNGHRLLLDCGPGVLPRLLVHEFWPKLDAIAITHLHMDHWGDLVPWVLAVRYGDRPGSPTPELWLPPGGIEELLEVAGMLAPRELYEECFQLREHDGRTTFNAGGLEVSPFEVPHYTQETYALRITDGERVAAYSADCGPSDAIVEAARNADLFLCEATLSEEGETDLRGHLTVEEATNAATRAGARRLVIIHRPAELPLDDSLERGYDGMEIEL
jgi:ribonuclease BN (tRNA processing enzyme)